MIIEKFEDILSWQQAQVLGQRIYDIFGEMRDFGFRDQICRASISVSNNIAEGFERKGNNEFRKFLYIAKGSCAEVRSMLYFAKNRKYCNDEEFIEMYNLTLSITKLLAKLITSLG